MSFWSKLLGDDAPPAPEPIIIGNTASDLAQTKAELNRNRFARAIVQAEQAVKRGETTPARLAELRQWYEYYDGMVRLEAAAPKPSAVDEPAMEEGEA